MRNTILILFIALTLLASASEPKKTEKQYVVELQGILGMPESYRDGSVGPQTITAAKLLREKANFAESKKLGEAGLIEGSEIKRDSNGLPAYSPEK